jgi:hypothetical protein
VQVQWILTLLPGSMYFNNQGWFHYVQLIPPSWELGDRRNVPRSGHHAEERFQNDGGYQAGMVPPATTGTHREGTCHDGFQVSGYLRQDSCWRSLQMAPRPAE